MWNSFIQALGAIAAALIQRPLSGKFQAQKDLDLIKLRSDTENLESRLNEVIDFLTTNQIDLPEPAKTELRRIQQDLSLVSREFAELSSAIDRSAYESARKWLSTKRKGEYSNGQRLIIKVLGNDKLKRRCLNDEHLEDVKVLLRECLFWVDKTLERQGSLIKYKVSILTIPNETCLLAIDLVQDNLKEVSQRSIFELPLSRYSYIGDKEFRYINHFLEKFKSDFLV